MRWIHDYLTVAARRALVYFAVIQHILQNEKLEHSEISPVNSVVQDILQNESIVLSEMYSIIL